MILIYQFKFELINPIIKLKKNKTKIKNINNQKKLVKKRKNKST